MADATVLMTTSGGAATPRLIGTCRGNLLLGVHAMGLGTCLIVFAVSAFRHDPGILKHLGLPAGEKVRAAIALGYPAASNTYQRLPGRKALVCRVWDPIRV